MQTRIPGEAGHDRRAEQGASSKYEQGDDVRFGFGENWRTFLHCLDDDRIAEAEKSLRIPLACERLDGLSFVDVGSGSGLFSLAARRLGAQVHSFDYDADSVACTTTLRDQNFPGDGNWTTQQGSVLDSEYLAGLGTFDVVYSWGVLHHTCAMRAALENAARLVGPGGTFVIALYNRTPSCRIWAWEKRWYAGATPAAQRRARRVYAALLRLHCLLRGRDFAAYVEGYRSKRGMDFDHDVHDWLGGYPYESVPPSEVASMLGRLGLAHVRSTLLPFSLGLLGSGCNEYVYRRAPHD